MEEAKMNLSVTPEDQIIEMDIDRLHDFKNHPFRVEMDANMLELKDSIEKYGILTPILARPVLDGYYEIISGHRRKYAAKQLGYRKVPVIIRVLKDDEAVVAMVDSNFQREYILPSEKAFAYKMKYDVLRRDHKKTIRGQIDYNHKGKRTVQVLAEEFGESPKQIQRYLKLTQLIPELLTKLDDDGLSFSAATEIAFLKEDEQRLFLEAMDIVQATPSLSQAQRIKQLGVEGKITLEVLRDILSEVKKDDVTRVTFKTEMLRKYFPKSYTVDQMRREIMDIIKIHTEDYWEN